MNLISSLPPPLPGLSYVGSTGELCPAYRRNLGRVGGLGFALDPFSAAIGGAASIFGTIKQSEAAKDQYKAEMAAIKSQNQQDQRQFAQEEAQAAIQPQVDARNQTMMGLYTIGAVALIVSGMFLVKTVKKD